MKTRSCLSIILLLLTSACATIPAPAERRATADALAASRGWQAFRLPSGRFELLAYLPLIIKNSGVLTIYIEGDGFAWITPSLASSDPTPRDPLALHLALAQPEGNAAYLARACQFVDAQARGCRVRYWTNARFSEEVIAASNTAIESLKERFQADRLILVGYSGGAAIAALVAARRQDIALLVSVAGNLDTAAWTRFHRLQPLDDSLNPIDTVDALQPIPQIYFAGGKDTNITPELVHAAADRFRKNSKPVVVVEPTFNHQCCWVARWPALWRRAVGMIDLK